MYLTYNMPADVAKQQCAPARQLHIEHGGLQLVVDVGHLHLQAESQPCSGSAHADRAVQPMSALSASSSQASA